MNALLTEALHAFGLDGAAAEFLQHNENLIYRVDGQYLLRIHKAAEGLHVQHDLEMRHAELAFLRHLSAKGMLVQRPIAETLLRDGTQATLLTWLEGHLLTKEEFGPDLQRQVGSMTARLHQAADGFAAPGMRRYDTAFYLSMADELHTMASRHSWGSEYDSIIRAACHAVADTIVKAADVAIHADLSPSNILLTSYGLAPIDFSLCGMGHPMLDLGILLASLSSAQEMQHVLQGYKAAGGIIHLCELEAGFAAGLLGCFAIHPNWAQEPWFRERLGRWTRQILLPVAEGRPMFDNGMNFVNT